MDSLEWILLLRPLLNSLKWYINLGLNGTETNGWFWICYGEKLAYGGRGLAIGTLHGVGLAPNVDLGLRGESEKFGEMSNWFVGWWDLSV